MNRRGPEEIHNTAIRSITRATASKHGKISCEDQYLARCQHAFPTHSQLPIG